MGDNIVVVRNLKKFYSQGDVEVRALRGVDFTLKSGEFTALMGPSGSGKTTLLNIIGALDVPTSGQIEVAGQTLEDLSKKYRSKLRKEKLGFVFQSYNLIPVLTAYENAEFVLLLQGLPEAERRQRVMEMLDKVGLKGLENRYPSELSGGQQQRVAVARAIVGHPALVLADEPTANLDSTTSEQLLDTMRELNEEMGVTFLFATHDPKIMDRAKRVVQMVDGRIETDSESK